MIYIVILKGFQTFSSINYAANTSSNADGIVNSINKGINYKNKYAMRTCICEAKYKRGKSYINMVNDR